MVRRMRRGGGADKAGSCQRQPARAVGRQASMTASVPTPDSRMQSCIASIFIWVGSQCALYFGYPHDDLQPKQGATRDGATPVQSACQFSKGVLTLS